MSPSLPDVLTLTETARHLKVCKETVRRALSSGALPGCKILGQWRVPADSLLEIQNQRTHKPNGRTVPENRKESTK